MHCVSSGSVCCLHTVRTVLKTEMSSVVFCNFCSAFAVAGLRDWLLVSLILLCLFAMKCSDWKKNKLIDSTCSCGYFVFVDALHVTVVNATVVNISWAGETLYDNNSTDIWQQNSSTYTVQFR